MSKPRRHPRRRRPGEHYAMIPVEVLTSDACRTLPHSARTALIALAAQYRGRNNGDLSLTWATGKPFGINSKCQLIGGIALLLERGLIQKTRQGGKKPLGPSLYAITWMPVDDLNGKIESGPTTAPSNAWATWSSGLPADQSTENHQHHRRGTSAPPADQRTPLSAPRADQTGTSIGTTGGAPSRSWREGSVHSNGADGVAVPSVDTPADEPSPVATCK